MQASTAADNTAMRRVLEKLGFVYEGTLRGSKAAKLVATVAGTLLAAQLVRRQRRR